jgi:hypothetical protein
MGGSFKAEEFIMMQKMFPMFFKNVKYFVESGTYLGESTLQAADIFKFVDTIEIFEPLYDKALLTLKDKKNVTCHLGDSLDVLKNLLHEDTVYFLDGHTSGVDSGKGREDVPLMSEINIILQSIKNNILLILDDARFFIFDNKPADWNHISIDNINNCVLKNTGHLPRVNCVINDRMYVLI